VLGLSLTLGAFGAFAGLAGGMPLNTRVLTYAIAGTIAYMPTQAYNVRGEVHYMNAYMSGFKALSDLTRMRALRMILISESPVCVCELSDALGLPQYQVSKHLAILRQAGLVTDSRVGTWVYYSLPRDLSGFTAALCNLVMKHLSGPVFEDDAERLKSRLELREDGRCVLGPNRSTLSEMKPRHSSGRRRR